MLEEFIYPSSYADLKFDKEEFVEIPYQVVAPPGTHPKILIVGDSPGWSDYKENQPFSNVAGKFLREELEDLTGSYILTNLLPFAPLTQRFSQLPSYEDCEGWGEALQAFIAEVQPERVILLGKSVYTNFPGLPERYHLNKSVTKMTRERPLVMEEILYGVSFNPSYITKNGGKDSPQYPLFISRLKRLIGKLGNETSESELDYTLVGLNDLDRVLTEMESDPGPKALDYEATHLDPWNATFRILGAGIATRSKAYYIHFDKRPSEEQSTRFIRFLRKTSPWTYNAKYEMKATWAYFGEFVPLNDAFALCKIDSSPRSLKENARKYLGAEHWEEDVHFVTDSFIKIFSVIKKLLKQEKWTEIAARLLKGIISDEDRQTLPAKLGSIYTTMADLEQLLSVDEVVEGLKQYPLEWAAIPARILGEYCGYDASYTVKLYDHLWTKYRQFYPFYISQTWLAFIMESYGMHWDDDTASELENYYTVEGLNCLASLVDLLDIPDELRLRKLAILAEDDSDFNKLNKLKSDIFNPLSNKYESQLPFWNAYQTDHTTAINVLHTIELECLQSPHIDDGLIYAKIIDPGDVNQTLENLLSIKTTDLSGTTFEQQAGIEFIQTLVARLGDTLDSCFRRFASEVIEAQYQAHTKYGGKYYYHCKECQYVSDDKLVRDCPKCKDEGRTQPTGDPVRLDHGVDVDNDVTWTDEFWMVYYLRRFKKVMKSRSTYIYGSVGRGNVYLSKVGKHMTPPRRVMLYDDVSKDRKLKADERWIMNSDFMECAAETRRWRARVHTIPWRCELREIYTPRDYNSIAVHYDYSQAEVRTLAAMAQEESLLKAFEAGMDVHKFVASRIWKIAESEITSGQRRFAKMACALGSTKIKLLDGTSITLEELVKREYSTYTYSFDPHNNEIKPGEIVGGTLTKYVDQTLRVYTEGAGYIECTIDHPFLLTDGTYVNASDLTVGSELETLFYRIPSKGAYSHRYEQIRNVRHKATSGTKNPEIKVTRQLGRWEMTHHMVEGYPEQGYNVDHIDENKLNNLPSNLHTLGSLEHSEKSGKFKRQDTNGGGHRSSILRVLIYLAENSLEANAQNYEKFRSKFNKSTATWKVAKSKFDLTELIEEAKKTSNKEVAYGTPIEKLIDPIKNIGFDNYRNLGVKVTKIEIVDHDTPVPVYGISVDKYHNYTIDLGEGVGIFTKNSFSILYGKTIEGFATDFMKGDVSGARAFFGDFFSAFPNVAKFIKEKHNEVDSTGKVSTIFGDPLWINDKDTGSRHRHAQNYCIQSSASSMAAYGMWILYSKMQKLGIDGFPMGFTHDSCDLDLYSPHLFPFIDLMYDVAEGLIKKRFGVPAKIDWEIGIHQNDMMELAETRRSEGEREYEFSCPKITFNGIIDMLKRNYIVDVEVTKEKSKKESVMELFLTRRAFSRYLGSDIVVYGGNIQLTSKEL